MFNNLDQLISDKEWMAKNNIDTITSHKIIDLLTYGFTLSLDNSEYFTMAVLATDMDNQYVLLPFFLESKDLNKNRIEEILNTYWPSEFTPGHHKKYDLSQLLGGAE